MLEPSRDGDVSGQDGLETKSGLLSVHISLTNQHYLRTLSGDPVVASTVQTTDCTVQQIIRRLFPKVILSEEEIRLQYWFLYSWDFE